MDLDKHILTPLLLLSGETPRSVKEYDNPVFYIDVGDLGFGMFANKDLSAGDLIYVFGGPIINLLETKARGERECMPIQIDDDVYIDTMAPGCYVNHSCDPNAGIRSDLRLVAIKNISRGEEIRFDYSTTMFERSYTMICHCLKPRCRGVVEDFDRIPLHVQEEYLDESIVMDFIAHARRPAPAKACARVARDHLMRKY